ncbi:hypothetical protein ACHAWU_003577 [Discostella pseudostelligera]|uniref:Uncharacterized protein n=1 Tax=Discostella pseudostelligera TaxID=259834 RepID=A0ABD3N3L2_9STRA
MASIGDSASSSGETRHQRMQRLQRQRRTNARSSSSSSSAASATNTCTSSEPLAERTERKPMMQSSPSSSPAFASTSRKTFELSPTNNVYRSASAEVRTPLSPPPSSRTTPPSPPPPPKTTSPKSQAVSLSIAESRRHTRSPSAFLAAAAAARGSPSPPPPFPKLNEISSPEINGRGKNHNIVSKDSWITTNKDKNEYQSTSNKNYPSRNNNSSSLSKIGGGTMNSTYSSDKKPTSIEDKYRNGYSSRTPQRITTPTTTQRNTITNDTGECSANSINYNKNIVTPSRKSLNSPSSSFASLPSDEGAPSGERNMWKDMPRRTTNNAARSIDFHGDSTTNYRPTPTWSKRNTDLPTSPTTPKHLTPTSQNGATALLVNNNNKPISVRQQVNAKFTKKDSCISNPVSLVKSSPTKNKFDHQRHLHNHNHHHHGHGGTPIWIHASLLNNNINEHVEGYAWEWVRGYLLPTNDEADDSITVAVDDPDTSLSNLNGYAYTIPKRYNDGKHILMGNAWWSSSETTPSSASSPSPTSITQSLHEFPPITTSASNNAHKHTTMPPQDLAELTHLHEPAIVHALRTRYHKDMIYTNTGNILLALNPFKMLNHLYTHEMMELFWSNSDGGENPEGCSAADEEKEGRNAPPPHAYAVAERAYSSMRHCLDGGRMGGSSLRNQTILVSGESGAGKTVTTKIIMRYLSILSQRHSNAIHHHRHGSPGVEMQVLQSNPVLESFGNARTVRNDNSSRFGKFIEMSFQARRNTQSSSLGGHCGSLLGATIDVYLLEKVRLVSVNPGERNYHVFYELLSPRGMNVKEKQRYKLTSQFGKGKAPLTVKDFSMTSVSGTFDRRDGVDDSDTYQELRTAMNTVGFSLEEQDGIFAVISALLHASNLQFVNDGGDKCQVNDVDGTSDAVSNLLGVSEDSLRMALTTSTIEARGELLVKTLSTGQADKALEATVKAIYGALFTYIVARINKSIEVQGDFRNNSVGNDVATIGVLDIFGFESFENNSFEQLCINYCNEALQQQFNRFVFKAEQAEYEREGIKWSNIDFPDNQETLDLIEAKRIGIFSVLDEQCRLPRRTDQTFAKSVYETCSESSIYFSASQMQMSKGRFVVTHYAGEVEYSSDNFILKNKDELPKSASNLLASSSVALVSELATIITNSGTNLRQTSGDNDYAPLQRSSSTLARPTVSGQFSAQLKVLRSRIEATEPHYIRCLKPNDQLVANHFDESLVAHQLNCAGVLPAMKIARAGFAMRYPHASFIQRYRPIVFHDARIQTRSFSGHRLTCPYLISLLTTSLENEMRQTNVDEIADIVSWGVQVGKTKVFMRTTAFEAFEKLRNSALNKAATILQARTRAFICQNKFYLILGSVLTLQCATRKLIASLYVRRLRFNKRSITIQKQWRSYFAWIRYQNILFITAWCQRFCRGKRVRKQCVRMKEYRSAIAIQSAWRSHVFQQCHSQLKNAAIVIQCCYRTRASVRALKQLKREAKDIKSISMERDKLRMEMKQIKQQLEHVRDMHNRNTLDKSDSWTTTDKTTASQEETIRLLSQECSKKDQELLRLRQEIESLRGRGRGVMLPPSSSTKGRTLLQTSTSLLDSESDVLPQLEYSQVSFPDSTMENTYEVENTSVADQSICSSFAHGINLGEIPFHQAIISGDKHRLLEEIRKASCVELGINSTDSKGRSPLHIAVQRSNLELVQILLSHDAIANTQDFSGNTALHYADSPDMTRVLLEGGVSPNIPNGAGLCSLHLAVKRRDFTSVKHLLSYGADVNNADDAYWYSPLHLVALADESQLNNTSPSFRGPIAELLCEAKIPSLPDLNYQDRNGNSPLHHAVSLVEEDAGTLISLFIENGSNPKMANNRGQTPIHIYCNNHIARQFVFYHEALHLMLAKGADPNTVSSSGCTALHLALYHQDMEAAALLVRYGAQLNMVWKKPQKWGTFWTDMGSEDVLPLDMLEDLPSLHRLLSEISTPTIPAPHRLKCMHCKMKFGLFARRHNCTHCGRSVCGQCCIGSIHQHYFPSLNNEERSGRMMFKVCSLCEPILLSKTVRVPISIVGGSCDQSSLGTISM